MIKVDQNSTTRIATITLQRSPVNALSAAMIVDLIDALHLIDRSDDVRAVIITGDGRCFSAGIDLREQLDAINNGADGPAAHGSALYHALLHGRTPTIAAINGPALGAGLGIAASCCILVASETAEVGLPEIDVGMLGGARHAMRLLGHSTVNRMLLTGHRIDAQELYRRGAIEACLPASELLPHANAIATEIAAKDPVAIEKARRSLSETETMSVLDGYRREMALATELMATPASRESMTAFLQRRTPRS